MSYVIGIVGAEEAKFTPFGRDQAEDAIRYVLTERLLKYSPAQDVKVSSGHCHLGGVDIWAEEIAKIYNVFDERLIFAPKELNWTHGYMPRNKKIAQHCNMLVNITVDVLPKGYDGMRHELCYHCAKNLSSKVAHAGRDHVKSGGCWTMWLADSLGKEVKHVIVRNYQQ